MSLKCTEVTSLWDNPGILLSNQDSQPILSSHKGFKVYSFHAAIHRSTKGKVRSPSAGHLGWNINRKIKLISFQCSWNTRNTKCFPFLQLKTKHISKWINKSATHRYPKAMQTVVTSRQLGPFKLLTSARRSLQFDLLLSASAPRR